MVWPGVAGRSHRFHLSNCHRTYVLPLPKPTIKLTSKPFPCHTKKLPTCRSYWGDALIWGFNNKKESAEACCNACSAYKPTPDKDNMDCNGEAGSRLQQGSSSTAWQDTLAGYLSSNIICGGAGSH